MALDTIDTNAWAVLARLLERITLSGSVDFDELGLGNTPANQALMIACYDWNERDHPKQHTVADLRISEGGQWIWTTDYMLLSYFQHVARVFAGLEAG